MMVPLEVMVSDMFSGTNFGYNSGLFGSVSETDWQDAAERLIRVRAMMSSDSGSHSQEHLWFLPMIVALTKLDTVPSVVVDVACGMSIPIWYSYVMGEPTSLLGFDMDPCRPEQYPPGAKVVQCQVLDPNSPREVTASYDSVGGLMVATEWLEHVEYNPLPPLIVLCERTRPELLYLSVPTFTNTGFMRPDWVHYSDLPSYRRQPVRYAPWHYKGWNLSELADLVDDLGYHVIAAFSGYFRCGLMAARISGRWNTNGR